MRRTLRILAVCALAFSILEAWYSLARLSTYSTDVFSLFPQLLRTTNVGLGLATTVVALVDSAQQRRRWRVGVFGGLALVITYGEYLPTVLFSLIPVPLSPVLASLSGVDGLRLFLLSYAMPTILTALAILAGEILPRPGIPKLSPAHEHDDGLEIHYSSLNT